MKKRCLRTREDGGRGDNDLKQEIKGQLARPVSSVMLFKTRSHSHQGKDSCRGPSLDAVPSHLLAF